MMMHGKDWKGIEDKKGDNIMTNKDKILIVKMLKYIEELHEFIEGYTYETFIQDKKTINACVFNLGQIGELAGKISDEVITQ